MAPKEEPGQVGTDRHHEGKAGQQTEQAELGALDAAYLALPGRVFRQVQAQAEPKAELREADQQDRREREDHPLGLEDGTEELVHGHRGTGGAVQPEPSRGSAVRGRSRSACRGRIYRVTRYAIHVRSRATLTSR